MKETTKRARNLTRTNETQLDLFIYHTSPEGRFGGGGGGGLVVVRQMVARQGGQEGGRGRGSRM